MGGLFDPQPDPSGDQGEGLTALDLMDLPPAQYRVMRLILRQGAMSFRQLGEANAAEPEDERLSQVDLDDALKALCEQNWLLQKGEGQSSTYRINLRRKVSNALNTFAAHSPEHDALSQSIWDALDANPGQESKPVLDFWDALDNKPTQDQTPQDPDDKA
jgi:hypothetical protein